MDEQKNAPKFAFYYMLSLVSLITMTVAVGMTIFQIVNKMIANAPGVYEGQFNQELLQSALSMLIIASPLYFVMMRMINKSLYSGELPKDSLIRKWLSYFIMFVASVVMLIWFIITLSSFFGGELTAKFILKALSSVLIAAVVFYYYFYDIRRQKTKAKDVVVSTYAYGSMAIVAVVLVSGFIFYGSPAEVRAKKFDQATIQQLEQVKNVLNSYYDVQKTVPDKLEDVLDRSKSPDSYITDMTLRNPETNTIFEYKKISADSYEICVEFKTSNKDQKNNQQRFNYDMESRWPHDKGRACFTETVMKSPLDAKMMR
jgi:hypothetical protein